MLLSAEDVFSTSCYPISNYTIRSIETFFFPPTTVYQSGFWKDFMRMKNFKLKSEKLVGYKMTQTALKNQP